MVFGSPATYQESLLVSALGLRQYPLSYLFTLQGLTTNSHGTAVEPATTPYQVMFGSAFGGTRVEIVRKHGSKKGKCGVNLSMQLKSISSGGSSSSSTKGLKNGGPCVSLESKGRTKTSSNPTYSIPQATPPKSRSQHIALCLNRFKYLDQQLITRKSSAPPLTMRKQNSALLRGREISRASKTSLSMTDWCLRADIEEMQSQMSIEQLYMHYDSDEMSEITIHTTCNPATQARPLRGVSAHSAFDDSCCTMENFDSDFYLNDDDQSNHQDSYSVMYTGGTIDTIDIAELNSLITFRRVCSTGEVYEATLNAKVSGKIEDSMEDLVKRLQQKADKGGVLKFEKYVADSIKRGDMRIIFSFVQVNGGKLSKDKFGAMKVSQVLRLTRERPILVEIQAVDSIIDESTKIF